MSKHSQDRFPRLAIVGPTDKKPRQQPGGQRWWGPERASFLGLNDAEQTTQTTQVHTIRKKAMPTFPRVSANAAIAWVWNFVRGYFVTTEQRRGAVVLSFRRGAQSFRRAVGDESFAGKKSNGSVGWQSDKAAPQEGGRG
jgi:hypothetical protein